jgi:biotin-(acetyl-CoA carboxylase) ligase
MLLAEYRRRDALRGHEISWEQGAGVAAGIDDDGELVVEAPGGGSVTLGSGEVSVRVSRA